MWSSCPPSSRLILKMLLIMRLSNSSRVSSLGVAVLLRNDVDIASGSSTRVLFDKPPSAELMRIVEEVVPFVWSWARFVNGFSSVAAGEVLSLFSHFGAESTASDEADATAEDSDTLVSEVTPDFVESDLMVSLFVDSGLGAARPASFSRRLLRICKGA